MKKIKFLKNKEKIKCKYTNKRKLKKTRKNNHVKFNISKYSILRKEKRRKNKSEEKKL